MNNRHLAVVLAIAFATATLTGCQSTSNSKGLTISAEEIQEMKSFGKVDGFVLSGDLEFIAKFGSSAQNQSQRILGTVVDVLSPVVLQVNSTETSPWVPVKIRVEQSDPKLGNETYLVRLFANSENMPDISRLHIGQRVLAVGGALSTDKAGVEAISLGWLLEVADDGSVANLNPNHEVNGNFNDVAELLRMEPLN
ncbi:MAG: hypothetical protein ACKOWR_06035 [Micrococcales bacterium]